MKVIKLVTPQCTECFSDFQGIIDNTEQVIKWYHPDANCQHDRSYFTEKLDAYAFNVIALKDDLQSNRHLRHLFLVRTNNNNSRIRN